MPYTHVLVPTDFSAAAAHAYPHAATLARELGARVSVLHVDELEVWSADRAELDEPLREHIALIETERDAILARFEGWGVTAEFHVVEGSPRQAITAFATEAGTDCIVMPRRSRRKRRWLVLGSTTERVLCTSTHPVLVTMGPPEGEDEAPDTRLPRYRHILAATDLSHANVAALQRIVPLAAAFEATLTAMHVERTPGVFSRQRGRSPITVLPRRARGKSEQQDLGADLARVAADMGDDVESRMLFGRDPGSEITKAIGHEDIDLITLGARGEGSTTLGSTAARVVRRSPVAVLVVPPPQASAG